MKFTIFTPTYNRGKFLIKLYEALKKQTYKDFEWIIVDDGSIDDTRIKINRFIEEKILDIKYFYLKNGGKQRAYNFALNKAKGDLFICIDSDDIYVENGLEIILNYWKNYENNEKIAGMGYLSIYPNGEIIGSEFPNNEMIETQFNIYNKYKVKGDKGLMFRTDVIKKYPFPIFDDEKFITEAVIYNRICEKYNILYINEKIEIKEYHNDGLTSEYGKLLLNNPKGHSLYLNEINRQDLTIKRKILNNAKYFKFSKIAKYSLKKIFFNSENKIWFIISLPVGMYMLIKTLLRNKK